jgi:hypothetical protein
LMERTRPRPLKNFSKRRAGCLAQLLLAISGASVSKSLDKNFG